MTKNRFLWLLALIAALLLPFCRWQGSASAAEGATATEQESTSTHEAAVGEVTGKVIFEGVKPKLARIAMDKDPVCVAEHSEPVYVEDGEVNSNETLPNVFVYVKTGADKLRFPIPTNPVVLDQKGCMYRPHVLGVMAGQELRIISSDPTTHNIHPMPKDNREWNQSQPPGAPSLIKKFAHPEIMIPVKCNQHPWMRAYIGVTNNPFYSVTGSDGTFQIKGLPPGDYTLEAWTATFGTQERKVTLRPKESTTVDFVFRAR